VRTSDQTITVSAAVITNAAGQLLLVRKRGTDAFMQPGGKPEPGEAPDATLIRELAEELGVAVSRQDLVSLGRFTAEAANEAGFTLLADVFRVDLGTQVPRPAAEIAELRWATLAEAANLTIAPLAVQFFPTE